LPFPERNPLECPSCGFSYFFNPTVAAAAFLFNEAEQVLFIRRARDPAKGKLGLPGGFIDIGESAEEALRREVREEVNLEIHDIRFLLSFPNFYEYRGVTYPVCDLIFTGRVLNPESVQALDAVDNYDWLRLENLTDDELAFPSIRAGRSLLLQR
jgi:mutator protein MutT